MNTEQKQAIENAKSALEVAINTLTDQVNLYTQLQEMIYALADILE